MSATATSRKSSSRISGRSPARGWREVPAPTVEEHLWTIAMARLIFAPEMNIQAPPNLSPDALRRLVDAGINDWGGVSPVTPDHVNPEAPWPHLRHPRACHRGGRQGAGREAGDLSQATPGTRPLGRRRDAKHSSISMDTDGFARADDWSPGCRWRSAECCDAPALSSIGEDLRGVLGACWPRRRGCPTGSEIVRLFRARGDE